MRRAALAVIAFVVVLTVVAWTAWSQPLKLAEGQFSTADGKPLANQTLLIEGHANPSWKYHWFPVWWSKQDQINRLAITDTSGYVQVVDMPPGQYTIKLVRPGAEPTVINKFTLSPGYSSHDFSAKFEGRLDLKERLQLEVNPKQ